MIITANDDTSTELVARLTNGTTQASPNHTGIKRKEIEWIQDVEAVLAPMKKDFAVY